MWADLGLNSLSIVYLVQFLKEFFKLPEIVVFPVNDHKATFIIEFIQDREYITGLYTVSDQ
jgi:uncharacterized protein YpmS